jgi:mono/diheme cytochrome c family protein
MGKGAKVQRAFLALTALPWFVCVAPAATVDFQRDIRPILSSRCFKCHGPAKQEDGVRLDLRDTALKRRIIVPGKPDTSKLIRKITEKDDDDRMPPAEAGDRLSAEQIAKLRAWIQQGAPYTLHWAFIKPQAAPLPAVRDRSWPRNAIDYFILARLEQSGMQPSPVANRATLIRRVYLDLLGLLPAPAEVNAFVKDARPDAYERLVDRLLASPHYGERQARYWLDLARYADSNGYTIDGPRSIWPYRDWVIRALNADMPFDRFTIEQLAGDLLPKATVEQKLATGFQRNTPFNEEGGTDPEQFRVERTVDRNNTTGAVWLGLTVACAQCHDHKYDPIRQQDYYQLYAFFNNAEESSLGLGTPEQEAERKQLRGELDKARREAKAATGDKKGPAAQRIKKLQQALKKLEATIPATMILAERKTPRETHILQRGDFLKPGALVQPNTPANLPSLGIQGRRANRLDLARWLVGPDNPLTARVVMNRMWQQYFGKGLVETENDFGMQGSPPTHPELLDWLAVEFMRRGWGEKAMHRLLVTSATYMQSSVVRPDKLAKDPKNRLLGRQARLRVEAEIVRDAALSASGLLSSKIGGRGVFPPQPIEVFSFTQSRRVWVESRGADRFRRGMYTYIWRQSQHPLLTTFDGPDAQTACTRRNRSNTPLQALHLANDPTFLEIAEALGRRVQHEGPADDAGRIDFAFRLCFARTPLPAERQRLLRYLETVKTNRPDSAWQAVARVLLNLDEFITRE